MPDQKLINHPDLGPLIFDDKFGWWGGVIPDSEITVSIDSLPNVESNIKNIIQFINWYSTHKSLLNSKLASELFNYDLVHSENFIENALNLEEEYFEKEQSILESKIMNSLVIKDVNSLNNALFVWVSASEYTFDHWIKVTLNERYEILEMGNC